MRRALLALFMLVVFALALALVLENLGAVEFHYLLGRVRLPLAAALAGALIVGAIIAALALLPSILGARARARHLRGRLRAAAEKQESLPPIPSRDAR